MPRPLTPLGSNRSRSLRQTVHTRRASVHQAAKLVAALLRIARATGGLPESNGSQVYDSRHLPTDCQEPGSAPEPYARQSSMGYIYLIRHLKRLALGLGCARYKCRPIRLLSRAVSMPPPLSCRGRQLILSSYTCRNTTCDVTFVPQPSHLPPPPITVIADIYSLVYAALFRHKI